MDNSIIKSYFQSPKVRRGSEVLAGGAALLIIANLTKVIRLSPVNAFKWRAVCGTLLTLSTFTRLAVYLTPQPSKPPNDGSPKADKNYVEKGKEEEDELPDPLAELLSEHDILCQPNGFSEKDLAIAVAMGDFKGAKKSNEAIAVQFKFIDRLKELVNRDQRQRFFNQLYGIDQLSEEPLKDSWWEGYSKNLTSDSITTVLTLLSISRGITDEYAKAPYQIELLTYKDGKWIAESKEEDYRILTEYLEKAGKLHGAAIDNGDCFYDALAQLLDSDVGTLRQQVLNELESDPEHYKADVEKKKKNNDWDTYIARVGLPAEKLPEDAIPCWGDIHFEGRILAEIHNLQIICHQVMEKKDREEMDVNVVPTSPIGPKDGKLVELANVGRHFIPVFPKLED